MGKLKIEIPYWTACLLGLLLLAQLFTMASVEKHFHNQRLLGPITIDFGRTGERVWGTIIMIGMAVILLYALRKGMDWLFGLISLVAIVVGLLFRLDLPEPQLTLDYSIVGGLIFGLIIKTFQPDGWLDMMIRASKMFTAWRSHS